MSIFIDTIQGKTTNRPPVWFMRQAGRISPTYRKLREKYSFQELMSDPKLAAEVTLMPVKDFGVDAAILFSDILVIPQALGLEVDFPDSGPVFKNALCKQTSKAPLNYNPSKLDYIYNAIDEINKTKTPGFPLIGFCGGPFTTYLFMAQGTSSNHLFSEAMTYYYNNRSEVLALLEQITEASIDYAVKQCEHGISAFQIFETYAGLLPTEVYLKDVYPQIKRLIAAVKAKGVPVIYFPKGLGTGLSHINDCGADFISIDWQVSLTDARKMVDKHIGLQGNFDPRLLSVNDTSIIAEALQPYKTFWQENKNFIFNLGHGLTPDNKFENAKFAIDMIKNF